MNLSELLHSIVFRLGEIEVKLGGVITGIVASILLILIGYWFVFRLLPRFFRREKVEIAARRKIRRAALLSWLFLLLVGLVHSMGLHFVLWSDEARQLRLTEVLEVLLIWQLARLIDTFMLQFLLHNYNREHEGRQIHPKRAKRIAQPLVYVLALLFLLRTLDLNFKLGTYNKIDFYFGNILVALAVVFGTRLAYWILTQIILSRYYRRHRINVGSQYAANQLLAYFLYVMAGLVAIEMMGIKLNVIWGGAAALLVGIGLGLQQTFNDLICGVILLFERTVEVGDVVEIESLVGSVKKIGLRTSLVETRDNITVIVPNSKLITDKVVNWSHYDDKARFHIKIGVAYGSDTTLVKKLLLEAVASHPQVLEDPEPFVRFTDFGDSSLDFEVLFWSQDFLPIENTKSDIRFEIDRLFREHNVVIPFPQRDVWIRKEE